MEKSANEHEQEVVYLKDKEIVCDKSLSGLVKELNNVGLTTIASCEGGVTYCLVGKEMRKEKIEDLQDAYVAIKFSSIEDIHINNNSLVLCWKFKNK